MNLAATFYISVYGLAALAGGILAWAEQTPSVTVLTVPLTVVALLLNERYRLLRLDGIWIGVAGFASFIYPACELFGGNEESRLLAVAHLLVIMEWVLLFSNKSAHQYWWICALSCLQIAVAAVLTTSALFGLLILLYMFWAMWTLSVFTLLLARLQYGHDEAGDASTGDWIWPRLHAGPVQSESSAVAAGASDVSEFRSSIQGNAHEADLNWRFVFGICGISISALSLGLVFFLLTPRLWLGVNPFQDSALGTSVTQTDRSEKVQLGDFGKILESAAPVLELRIVDEGTGEPVNLHEYLAQIGQTEPLLRGTVLAIYQGGTWAPYRPVSPRAFDRQPAAFPDRNRRFIRQSIRLEPIGTRSLFSLVDPQYGFVDDQMGSIHIFDESHVLSFRSSQSLLRGAFQYHLMAAERKGPFNAQPYHIDREAAEIAPVYLIRGKNCPVVDELARQLVERIRGRMAPLEPSPSQIAQTIVTHLRDTGGYRYSLDQSVHDPRIDPVEDFLKNRKAGHCQYFATALALLLRSADIPSRVVTGFKGGVEDSAAGLVKVQQRHAHAWVEAHLKGQWVTLDATPSDEREESVQAVGDSVRWYHQLMAAGATIWSDYFVNLSYSKQQRDLYRPLQGLAGFVTDPFKGKSNFWSVLQANLREFWRHPQSLFSVRGGLMALLLLLTFSGIYYCVRLLWRLLVRISGGTSGRQSSRMYIEFHERFLALLKPLGMVPQTNQTQLEFAVQVETAWQNSGLPPEFVSLARDISDAFYCLRFGTDPLSPEQEDRITAQLGQLEIQVRRQQESKKI